jgi:hypothetical protein
MLLTPLDMEGTKGISFEKDGTVRVQFDDGSEVIMGPGKNPRCIPCRRSEKPGKSMAKKWLENMFEPDSRD